MFLKTVVNPYENGLPARTLIYRPNETQTYAINAEQLHKNPQLLNTFGKGNAVAIRLLDIFAYAIALAGIAGSVFFAVWLFLPAFLASTAMWMTNRKTAGAIARKAAAESNEHFLYLHSEKALWLVTEPAEEVVLEA